MSLSESTNRNYRRAIYLIIAASAVIHLVALYLGNTHMEHWRFEHLPLHSVVEVAGSFIAFFVAYLLIVSEKREEGTSFNIAIAGALVGMGVMDGLHAIVNPGAVFVWLHSVATFIGGLLFSTLYLSQAYFQRLSYRWPVIVFIFSSCIGVASILFPQFIPPMVEDGKFTTAAMSLNVGGGVLLILSAFKLFSAFTKKSLNNDLLFVLHCSMFGLAAIMFQQSSLWDITWWGWHVLRFAAYGVALWFALSSDVISKLEIKAENQQLNSELEKQVYETSRINRDLESSQNVLQGIVNNLYDALIIIDTKGIITRFTPSAERMFGYSAPEMVGKKVNLLMCQDDADHHDHYLENYSSSQSSRRIGLMREMKAKRKNGEVFPIELVITEINMDRSKYIIGTIRDITERKNSETMVMNALEEAKSASIMKGEFLANMSHEIRTPMNAIYGSLQLLQAEKNLSERSIGLVKTALVSTKTLLTIINDILDFSKIEAGKLSIEETEFDVKELFKRLLGDVERLVDKKSISIINNCDDLLDKTNCLGDPVRLYQVFLNIASNAVKFTEQGSVTFTLSQEKTNESTSIITYQVKDTGIGISEENVKELFSRFKQADGSITRKFGGTGLGLSITQSLIELMEGEIKVESELGKGTTMTITLPIKIGNHSALNDSIEANKPVSVPLLAATTILVAEDNEINREILSFMLEGTEANIHFVENGLEALEQTPEIQPDLVLMDIQMPVMDGKTACSKLREQGFEKPIIALTANVMESDIKQYLATGFDNHLGKPIEANELFHMLKKSVA